MDNLARLENMEQRNRAASNIHYDNKSIAVGNVLLKRADAIRWAINRIKEKSP